MFSKRQIQIGWTPIDPTTPTQKPLTQEQRIQRSAEIRAHVQWVGKLALIGYAAKTAIDTASKIAIITAEKGV